MDYIGLSTILSFPACETKQCVDVTIVDDDVLENVESFSVSLEGPGQDTRTVRSPDLYMRIRLHPMYGSGVAEITDNGGLFFSSSERELYGWLLEKQRLRLWNFQFLETITSTEQSST